jgi:hypothetical protein
VKKFFIMVLSVYGLIGSFTMVISGLSLSAYYSFGPGAIWEIGFFASSIGLFVAVFFSVLRILTWPFGLYILFTNPSGFLSWLFYLWYQ